MRHQYHGCDDRCRWHGTYSMDLQLQLDEAQIEWEQEFPEEE